ncbi:MAG: InlB B-repeat-containing protein, partial [Propionibacteriaceae bacterium]|nr:InlB B-repeat-containing protein [Propionibacteriaceae bacterium]
VNNGNIGYDNNCGREWQGPSSGGGWVGSCDWDSASRTALGTNTIARITPENVFAEGATPTLQSFADTSGIGGNERAGASGAEADLKVYMISPRTDEIYRDGSGPYYVANVRRDTRGFVRDHYPNAGPVEIYWTKFDPGTAAGGQWTASIPVGAIQSVSDPLVYYQITNPLATLLTFPRVSIDNSNPQMGFQGWLSNQPTTPGGTDYPLYQPWSEVQSTKQTFTAQWRLNEYRVDFKLMYQDGGGVEQWGVPLIGVPAGSLIAEPQPTRAGFNLAGWYKDDQYTQRWDFNSDTVTSDIILYAEWTEVEAPCDPDAEQCDLPQVPTGGSIGSDDLGTLAALVVMLGATAVGVARRNRRPI